MLQLVRGCDLSWLVVLFAYCIATPTVSPTIQKGTGYFRPEIQGLGERRHFEHFNVCGMKSCLGFSDARIFLREPNSIRTAFKLERLRGGREEMRYLDVENPHEQQKRRKGPTLLRYYRNEKGRRVYTLEKIDPTGLPTLPAHPPRFNPNDQYSRQRVTLKLRHGLLDKEKMVREMKELWVRLGSDPLLMGEENEIMSRERLHAIRDASDEEARAMRLEQERERRAKKGLSTDMPGDNGGWEVEEDEGKVDEDKDEGLLYVREMLEEQGWFD